MVLELNGSNDRGIKIVRERILGFASGIGLSTCFDDSIPPYKIIILDEADAMTNEAQFTLRRVIEDYVENVRFCLICNYVNKIIPALQSRCIKFRFGKLNRKDIFKKVSSIATKEKINITEHGINAIVDSCDGDMRKAINNLQMVSMYNYTPDTIKSKSKNKNKIKSKDKKSIEILEKKEKELKEEEEVGTLDISSKGFKIIGETEVNYIMGNLNGISLQKLLDVLLEEEGKYSDFDSKLDYLHSVINHQIVLLQLVINISKELVKYCKKGKLTEEKLEKLLQYLAKLEHKIIKCSLVDMYYGELVSIFILCN